MTNQHHFHYHLGYQTGRAPPGMASLSASGNVAVLSEAMLPLTHSPLLPANQPKGERGEKKTGSLSPSLALLPVSHEWDQREHAATLPSVFITGTVALLSSKIKCQ